VRLSTKMPPPEMKGSAAGCFFDEFAGAPRRFSEILGAIESRGMLLDGQFSENRPFLGLSGRAAL